MKRYGLVLHNLHFLPPDLPGVYALLERGAYKEQDVKIYKSAERTISGFYVYTSCFGGEMGRKKVLRNNDLEFVEYLENKLEILIRLVGDDKFIDNKMRSWHEENIVFYHGKGMLTKEIAAVMNCSPGPVQRVLRERGLAPNLPLGFNNQYMKRAA